VCGGGSSADISEKFLISLAYRVHREAAARNAHKGPTISAGSSSGNYESWTALRKSNIFCGGSATILLLSGEFYKEGEWS
jgi:hypothetical protein